MGENTFCVCIQATCSIKKIIQCRVSVKPRDTPSIPSSYAKKSGKRKLVGGCGCVVVGLAQSVACEMCTQSLPLPRVGLAGSQT